MSIAPFAVVSRLFAAPVQPPSLAFLWVAGIILFQAFYTAIFATFWPAVSIAAATLMAATNVLPLAALTAVARAILKTYVMPLGVVAQGLAHLALAPLFPFADPQLLAVINSVYRE